MLETIEEQRNDVSWQFVQRDYKQEGLFERVHFTRDSHLEWRREIECRMRIVWEFAENYCG
jgi:hypothetical protein